MEPTSTYRADIDGLRAIAVLLVVFYHFGIGPLGGFIGVDVFFVISGYLITRILAREIAAGKFSLLRFYERRVRRILPALLVMIMAAGICGWLWLLPSDYASFGWQGVTAAFGISNFYFLENSDYFAANSELMPLLHTWSLAVEEQFYLFWPLLLWASWKLFRGSTRSIVLLLAGIIALSLAFSQITLATDQPVAFYMLPSRAWELSVGALLAFVPAIGSRALSQILPIGGVLLIALSSMLITSETPFPGFAAIAPCIGAAMVIWPRNHPSLGATMLSWRPAQFIGKISYSLYLWHWPIVVYFRHLNLEQMPTVVEAIGLLIAAVLISTFSWRYIEQPFRRSREQKSRNAVLVGIVAMSGVGILSYGIAANGGVEIRLPSNVRTLAASAYDKSPRRVECHRDSRPPFRPLAESCVFGASEPAAALWGDSHGVEIGLALGEVLGSRGQGLMMITASACAPALNYEAPNRPHCIDHNAEVLDFLISHPTIETIYMISSPPRSSAENWQNYGDGIEAAVTALSQAGKAVVLFDPVPRGNFSVPQAVARQALTRPDKILSHSRASYEAANSRTLELFSRLGALSHVTIIKTPEAFCDTENCALDDGHYAYYFDEHHLSNFGARHLISTLDFNSYGGLVSMAE